MIYIAYTRVVGLKCYICIYTHKYQGFIHLHIHEHEYICTYGRKEDGKATSNFPLTYMYGAS